MKQQKAPIDYQLDYMEHLFFSIKHKKTESYVIHRIWDKLDDTRILFKGQQEVLLPNGKHALADLYLPQLNIFVEVNEPYHENQVEEDEYRNTNIVNLTHGALYIIRCGKPEKKGEWRTLEEIHQQIDECVACIKEKIAQSIDCIKPWNMSKWLTVEYHKEKGILNVEDQDCLRTIDDICAIFDTTPKHRGFLRMGTTPVPGKENFEIWYPNINNRSGWSNELSPDGETFTEYYKDEKKREEHVADCINDNKKRIAFFRTKDALGIELYRFAGVFHLNTDATREKGKCIWHRDSKIYEL